MPKPRGPSGACYVPTMNPGNKRTIEKARATVQASMRSKGITHSSSPPKPPVTPNGFWLLSASADNRGFFLVTPRRPIVTQVLQ